MKIPVKNLAVISIVVLTEKTDIIEVHMLAINDIFNSWTLPKVSARNPIICELTTTPKYPTEFKNPFSNKENCNSHWAEYETMLNPTTSAETAT